MRHILKVYLKTTIILFSFHLVFSAQSFGQTTSLGFIGASATSEGLSNEEKVAFEFAQKKFNATYLSLEQVSEMTSPFEGINVLWWHSNTSSSLPTTVTNNKTIEKINEFLDAGNGLFLSGFSTQLVVNLGLEDTQPQEVVKNNTTSGDWGFMPKEDSPIFNNLPSPFITLSSGNTTENVLSWWNQPDTFDGVWLADTEWNSGTLVTVGEYEKNKGSVVVVGAGAYDWHLSEGTNENVSNLELFTNNIVQYLTPKKELSLGFIISQEDTTSLDREILAALEWAEKNYELSIISLKSKNKLSQLRGQDVLWWHEVLPDTLFNNISKSATDTLLALVNDGKGILFSGTASIAVNKIGLEENTPDTLVEINNLSSSSGFSLKAPSNPIFKDFGSIFLTLSSDLEANQRTYIWSQDAFGGKLLADTQFQDDEVSVGLYTTDERKVIIIGSRAFDWYQSGGENEYLSNLTSFTSGIFDYLKVPNVKPEVISNLSFEQLSDASVTDSINNRDFVLFSNFESQIQEGPVGQSLRFDGYSTWLSSNIDTRYINDKELSIETWVALESNSVGKAAFVSHTASQDGFVFGINNIGYPYFKLRLNNRWETLTSDQQIEKREWVHLVAVFDGDSRISIYKNGEIIANKNISDQFLNPAYDQSLLIGRNQQAGNFGQLYPTGIMNGYVDEIKIYGKALSGAEIKNRFEYVNVGLQPVFDIPENRYDDDIHRPLIHPMPSSDWTNETHGLTYFNDKYHLFFQKNPTGPFFSQLHWGHLVSDDLLKWEEIDYAFGPEASYDKAGTWSGAVVVEEETLHTFYTGVDGVKASIANATSLDGVNFSKNPSNPLIPAAPTDVNHMDFRDPYLWKEGSTWYMIVGTGINNVGGGVFLYSSSDLENWEYLKLIQLGSIEESGTFWEMPVMMKFGDKRVLMVNPVPRPGNPAILLYWVGEWKDENFVPDHSSPKKMELINHLLSPSVYEKEEGKYLATGIVPDQRSDRENYNSGWVHLYSLMREYYLEDGELYQKPYSELRKLRDKTNRLGTKEISPGDAEVLAGVSGKTLEIEFDLVVEDGGQAGIDFFRSDDGSQKTTLRYDKNTGRIEIDLNNSSSIAGVQTGVFTTNRAFTGDTVAVRIFLDKSIVEVFVNGKFGFAKRVYPDKNSNSLRVFSSGSTTKFLNLNIHDLNSDLGTSNNIEQVEEYNFELLPNYPNPFNPTTNIAFTLNKSAKVSLQVYDILGRKVATLLDKKKLSAGLHNQKWNASSSQYSLPSGVYLVRLETGSNVQIRKMTLIK